VPPPIQKPSTSSASRTPSARLQQNLMDNLDEDIEKLPDQFKKHVQVVDNSSVRQNLQFIQQTKTSSDEDDYTKHGRKIAVPDSASTTETEDSEDDAKCVLTKKK